MSSTRLGASLSALSAFLAAAFFVPYKSATNHGAADVLVIALLLPAAVFNTLTTLADRREPLRLDRTNLYVAFLLAIGTVIGNVSVTNALAALDAGITSLILQTQILFVALASWLFLHERITGRFVAGTIVAAAGFAVVRLAGGGTVAGSAGGGLWALGAALSFGMMHVITRKHISRIQPVTVNALRLWMAVALLVALPGRAVGLGQLSTNAWLLAGVAAFFGPFLGRLTIMFAVKHIPASYSTLITITTPVFAFALEFFFLGTTPSFMEVVGGTIILAGVAIPVLELVRQRL